MKSFKEKIIKEKLSKYGYVPDEEYVWDIIDQTLNEAEKRIKEMPRCNMVEMLGDRGYGMHHEKDGRWLKREELQQIIKELKK